MGISPPQCVNSLDWVLIAPGMAETWETYPMLPPKQAPLCCLAEMSFLFLAQRLGVIKYLNAVGFIILIFSGKAQGHREL